jgi:hypothetical protein
MAMTAQEYLDTFNAAINAGAYDSAANILKAAEGDFGPGVYDVAGVVLESNASLPPEIDFMSPQGIQSIRDYVNTATAPPPAPVDPKVETFNSLIREGKFDEAGVLATEEGFSPEQVLPYLNDPNIFPEFGGNVTLDTVKSFVPKPPAPPPAAVDPVAQDLLGRFDRYMDAASSAYGTGAADFMFSGAANVVNEAAGKYGDDVYGIVANYLNTDPRFAGLREQIGIGQKDTPAFDADNVRSFVESQIATEATPVTSVTPEDEAAVPTAQTTEDEAAPPTAQTTPGPGQIYGIPRFARQTQSNVPFAPLRRGLAQLRPAMYMPGLTSGQAPLGGSGFTPEALRTANQGLSPADRAYLMDVGGVSPAEASAAIGTPVGQLQAEYNQSRPGGLFSTGVPAPRGLPEDFTLQTGAYGAPTPTFLNRNATAAGGTAAGPAGADQPTYAQLLDNVQRLSAQVQPLLGTNQVDYGGGDGGFGDPSAGESATGDGQGNDSDGGPGGAGTPSGGGDPSDDNKMGGLIRMAEGGGPPKMAELSAKEAGSTFDISKYIDDDGRLVGGMSKPIRDAYGKIIGYESGDLPLPIQRDVVFGRELREKEAAMRLTDAEREQMMMVLPALLKT